MSPAPRATRQRPFKPDRDVEEWHGPYVPYDLVKEALVALVAVGILIAALTIVFSSPDEHPVTLKSWSLSDPVGFAQTAITELDRTSALATYGPPYNATTGSSQSIGFYSPEKWFGVHQPLDTAQDFVIGPLETLVNQPALHQALLRYLSAGASQQATWNAAYEKGAAKATFASGALRLPVGPYGPVARLVSSLTSMARSGALDGALLRSSQFYDTNYTKPLLFIAGGSFFANLAAHDHLAGNQWGMMNETGSFPGQAWLWLYTLWYQVPPMNSSSNADLQVWMIMLVLTLVLLFVPFIPGLRSIPRWSRVYRVIWREHYRRLENGVT